MAKARSKFPDPKFLSATNGSKYFGFEAINIDRKSLLKLLPWPELKLQKRLE